MNKSLDIQDKTFTITVNGLNRSYLVHVPPSYNGKKPVPVILIFHGGGGDASEMAQVSRMDEASDEHGFLAVYPQGTGHYAFGRIWGTWNGGKCCGSALKENVDDVAFVSALIDELKRNYNVDSNRIYATGHSNGAQMAYRLACELSDKIAAIAPVGGTMDLDSCSPDRRVPIIHFHGTLDRCSPYLGGKAGGCLTDFLSKLMRKNLPSQNVHVAEPIPEMIAKLVKINGVSGHSQIVYQKREATCKSWGKGTSGEVVLCTVSGMGHTWPGGTYGAICDRPESRGCRLYKEAVGPLTDDLNANEMMWRFFLKHPLH